MKRTSLILALAGALCLCAGAAQYQAGNGRQSGSTNGYPAGFAAGVLAGWNGGSVEGYASGYTVGTNDGYAIGFLVGTNAGWTTGTNAGYPLGYIAGTNIAFPAGFASGYVAGSNAIWSIAPVILGKTNAISGDTLAFTNAMANSWNGRVSGTSYHIFTNVFVNSTSTQEVQAITVSNGRATGSLEVLVNPARPVAAFSGSPTSGAFPLTVLFTNTSAGVTTNATWTFGDGGTSNTLERSISYTYAAAGTNTVSLSLVGWGSSSTLARTNYIVASDVLSLGSLTFDGTQNYASAEFSSKVFPVSGPGLTVECWMKIPVTGGGQHFINTLDPNSPNLGWSILINGDNSITFYMCGSGGTVTASAPAATDPSVWNHYAAVWDGSYMEVYVNGVPSGNPTSYSASDWASTYGVNLGSIVGSSGFFPGSLAEVRISTNAVYTSTFTPSSSLSKLNDTVVLWHFTEGSGATAADSSGNGATLTLFGDPIPTWGTFP